MLCRFRGIVLGLLCVSASAWGQYVITTVAGEGPYNPGYSGDGLPPTQAQLNFPTGVAYSNGKLYIADSLNSCVRVISAGAIHTFAGICGTPGFLGDGGAATAAELYNPTAVAVDQNGDVLIADTTNNVVRIVVPTGIISTFAGVHTDEPGYAGDGGPAINAILESPNALAVDSVGNVYITDPIQSVIRKVSSTSQCAVINTVNVCGHFISTAVGTGTSSGILQNPSGVAVGPDFAVYISDTSHRVFKYANDALTVLAGTSNIGAGLNVGDGGPAVKALLNDPIGLSLDSAGNLYIADAYEFRIRVVTPDGIITTIAGSGQDGYTGDGGPATSAELYFPHAAVPDGNGNIYVVDTGNSVIRFLSIPGPVITSNRVVNAASLTQPVAPGGLAAVFGTNLATSTTSNAAAPLPLIYAEASITVNGVSAPIMYASPTQINFQIPYGTTPGTATVVVTVDGVTSNSMTVPVTAAAPGIFNNYGVAIAQNYSPTTGYSTNSTSNPVPASGYLIAYLTGSGVVSPTIADGAATPSTGLYQIPLSSISATIGGMPATVIGNGLAAGFVSLWQLDIAVPSGLAAGSYPLVVTVNGQVSNSATVSVAP